MIDQASEVNNDVAKKRYEDTKGSTKKVVPANGSDLERQRLEQKKVDDNKPKREKSGKDKSREFKEQYVKKHNESKNAERQDKSDAGKPEYGTYGSNNLSYEIQQHTNPIRNKLLGKSKEKDLGEK